MPYRVQLRRVKGYRKPPNTVSVMRPGPYGNPFRVGDTLPDGTVVRDNAHAVRLFTDWVPPELIERARDELRGKNLGCACELDEMCHADVWLRVANATDPPAGPSVRPDAARRRDGRAATRRAVVIA